MFKLAVHWFPSDSHHEKHCLMSRETIFSDRKFPNPPTDFFILSNIYIPVVCFLHTVLGCKFLRTLKIASGHCHKLKIKKCGRIHNGKKAQTLPNGYRLRKAVGPMTS